MVALCIHHSILSTEETKGIYQEIDGVKRIKARCWSEKQQHVQRFHGWVNKKRRQLQLEQREHRLLAGKCGTKRAGKNHQYVSLAK